MCPVRKIKDWLFGTHERKEEKRPESKPEEHTHQEHQVTIYEEKPPALTHLRRKNPAQAGRTAKGRKKIHPHRKIKELKTMAKKKTTKKKVTKGKKKKR